MSKIKMRSNKIIDFGANIEKTKREDIIKDINDMTNMFNEYIEMTTSLFKDIAEKYSKATSGVYIEETIMPLKQGYLASFPPVFDMPEYTASVEMADNGDMYHVIVGHTNYDDGTFEMFYAILKVEQETGIKYVYKDGKWEARETVYDDADVYPVWAMDMLETADGK